MKLIALVTIVGVAGKDVPPGELFDLDEKKEAESLVLRGLAAKPPAKTKAKDEADDAGKPDAGKPDADGKTAPDGKPAA